MPNPNDPQAGPKTVNDFLNLFAGVGASHADLEPKDDPVFIASCAEMAKRAADAVAHKTRCPCKRCKLGIFEAKVAQFMCSEVVRAAHTGDTSRLQAVLAKVEELQKS